MSGSPDMLDPAQKSCIGVSGNMNSTEPQSWPAQLLAEECIYGTGIAACHQTQHTGGCCPPEMQWSSGLPLLGTTSSNMNGNYGTGLFFQLPNAVSRTQVAAPQTSGV